MRARLAALAVAVALIALAVTAPTARAASTNCAVNASGGYKNCLSYLNPSGELVKAWHTTGLPYRFQMVRFSDGAVWGWWQYSDLAYHGYGLHPGGTLTSQVDNMGTANPASWYVEMF